jgi:hypothetical protein
MFDTPNFTMAKGGSNFPQFLSRGMNFFNIKKHCLDFSFVLSAYRAWGTALKSGKGLLYSGPSPIQKPQERRKELISMKKNSEGKNFHNGKRVGSLVSYIFILFYF